MLFSPSMAFLCNSWLRRLSPVLTSKMEPLPGVSGSLSPEHFYRTVQASLHKTVLPSSPSHGMFQRLLVKKTGKAIVLLPVTYLLSHGYTQTLILGDHRIVPFCISRESSTASQPSMSQWFYAAHAVDLPRQRGICILTEPWHPRAGEACLSSAQDELLLSHSLWVQISGLTR